MSSEQNPPSQPQEAEIIPQPLRDDLHGEAGRLHAMGKLLFSPGILGPETNDADNPANILDRVRYKKHGTVVTLVPMVDWLEFDDAVDLSSSPLNVVIETPLPSTPAWPNSYIFENFMFDVFAPFSHHLDVKEYTPKGRQIPDRDTHSIMGEHLPELNQNVTDWEIVNRSMGEALDANKRQKMDELRKLFPGFMGEFDPKNLIEHARRVLVVLKSINASDEVGHLNFPFARD